MNDRVLWTDVAPRDGLQNVASTVSTHAKVRLVRGLLDAGAPRVEATAFVSPQWVPHRHRPLQPDRRECDARDRDRLEVSLLIFAR